MMWAGLRFVQDLSEFLRVHRFKADSSNSKDLPKEEVSYPLTGSDLSDHIYSPFPDFTASVWETCGALE